MKVLIISSKFPNKIQYQHGMYVYGLVRELSNFGQINVISPVSLTPPIALLKKSIKDPKSLMTFYSEVNSIPRFDNYRGIPVQYPKVLYFPKKIGYFTEGTILFLRLLPVVFQLKKRFKFDLIHAHFAFPEGYAAAMLGKVFGVPSLIHCQGSDIKVDLGSTPMLTRMIKSGLNLADHVFAVSNDIRSRILDYVNLNGSLEVLPNGVNICKFHPMSKRQMRKKLNLPQDKKILLYIGNLFDIKGVNYLIDAMEVIRVKNPDVVLYILGEGTLRDALTRKVQNLNLEDRVFFKGSIQHDFIPDWMNAGDLFILPSISEGWPTVLPESLACGTPVVASRVGGIPEMINSENIGLLTNPRDSLDLAKKITQALQTEWNKKTLIKRAKDCSWEKIAKQVIQVYKKLI